MTCKNVKLPDGTVGILCVGDPHPPTDTNPCMEKHWSLGKACRKCEVDRCHLSGLHVTKLATSALKEVER